MIVFKSIAATGVIAATLFGFPDKLGFKPVWVDHVRTASELKTSLSERPRARYYSDVIFDQSTKSSKLQVRRVADATQPPATRRNVEVENRRRLPGILAPGAPIPRVRQKPRFIETVDLNGPLGRFSKKLSNLEAGLRDKPVVIVHIGDSHIASDSFTRGIRSRLQKRFGSAGRGAVIPAKAFKYAAAQSVKLSASGPWRSWMSLKSKVGVFGLSGVRVESSSPSAKQIMVSREPFDWADVAVVTGPARGTFVVTVGGVRKRFSARAKTVGSRTFRVKARGTSVTVSPGGDGKLAMLHWATGRDRAGIRYINFGQIGATARVTRRWNARALASNLKAIDPDLIVYGFGTNEGYNDNLNIPVYKKNLRKFASQLRQSAENADLMIIGAASGLRKRKRKGIACGSGWYAPPKLGALRSAMQKLSGEIGAGFWNWSAAMGGACSIKTWAKRGWAARDQVHLTAKGYDASAKAFVAALLRPLDSSVELANKQ